MIGARGSWCSFYPPRISSDYSSVNTALNKQSARGAGGSSRVLFLTSDYGITREVYFFSLKNPRVVYGINDKSLILVQGGQREMINTIISVISEDICHSSDINSCQECHYKCV